MIKNMTSKDKTLVNFYVYIAVRNTHSYNRGLPIVKTRDSQDLLEPYNPKDVSKL